MITISKLLNRNLNLTVSSIRSIYSAEFLGIGSFQKYCQTTQKNANSQIENIKKNLQDTLSKPDGKIFVEDLKTALYCAKTDEDLDLLKNSIERYTKQDKIEIFHFDVPFMRLLYTMNKTDKALELFMTQREIFVFSAKAIFMLMNKLVEEKRFDDTIKVFDQISEKFFEKKSKIEIVNLYSYALFKTNDFDKLKSLIKQLSEKKMIVPLKTQLAYFLLCVQRKDIDSAKEIAFGAMEDGPLKKNLQIISLLLASNDNLKRATEIAKDLISLNYTKKKRLIYKETLQLVNKALKETNDKESSALVSDIKEEETRSLKDRLEEVVDRRQTDRLNPDISTESNFSNKGKFFNKADSQKKNFSNWKSV